MHYSTATRLSFVKKMSSSLDRSAPSSSSSRLSDAIIEEESAFLAAME